MHAQSLPNVVSNDFFHLCSTFKRLRFRLCCNQCYQHEDLLSAYQPTNKLYQRTNRNNDSKNYSNNDSKITTQITIRIKYLKVSGYEDMFIFQ